MTGHPLAKRGAPHGPPTALRTPHQGLWPPPPSLATYWLLTGHPGGLPLATDWPQRGGHRREAFAPPHSGHPLATYSPTPAPADRGLRTGRGKKQASPTPTYWPKELTDWPH